MSTLILIGCSAERPLPIAIDALDFTQSMCAERTNFSGKSHLGDLAKDTFVRRLIDLFAVAFLLLRLAIVFLLLGLGLIVALLFLMSVILATRRFGFGVGGALGTIQSGCGFTCWSRRWRENWRNSILRAFIVRFSNWENVNFTRFSFDTWVTALGDEIAVLKAILAHELLQLSEDVFDFEQVVFLCWRREKVFEINLNLIVEIKNFSFSHHFSLQTPTASHLHWKCCQQLRPDWTLRSRDTPPRRPDIRRFVSQAFSPRFPQSDRCRRRRSESLIKFPKLAERAVDGVFVSLAAAYDGDAMNAKWSCSRQVDCSAAQHLWWYLRTRMDSPSTSTSPSWRPGRDARQSLSASCHDRRQRVLHQTWWSRVSLTSRRWAEGPR